jgi:hypothetical protein
MAATPDDGVGEGRGRRSEEVGRLVLVR